MDEEEELRKELNKRIKTLTMDTETKEELFKKLLNCYENGFKCFYCKERMELKFENELGFTIDHTIPKAKNGKDNVGNLEFVCFQCNSMKADKDAGWFIKNVKRLKERKRRREEAKAIRAATKDKRVRDSYKQIFTHIRAEKEREHGE